MGLSWGKLKMTHAASAANFAASLDADSLVKEYLPLVKKIARRYSRVNNLCVDDLTQVGCLGLLKAIRYYNPNRQRKASLRTVAIVYIKGEIRHYLRDQASLVQIPRRLGDLNNKIVHLEEALSKQLAHTPTIAELAKHSGHCQAEVLEAQQSWLTCRYYESFDSAVDDDSAGESRTLSELIADKKHMTYESQSEESEVLRQALVNLGEKTRQIIEFVYFYDLSQKETAQILGLSEMGVSRAVKSAVKKLKEILLTEIF